METEFIVPMTPWANIGNIGSIGSTRGAGLQGQEGVAGDGTSLFGDIFKSVVNQVKETQADVETKQYLLSTGQLDDAHTLPIAEAKAGFTVDMLLTLRNKTLESYNELIKINV